MPRHKRLEIPGAIYHVIARGLERREIFRDDADRKEFIGRLEKGIKETNSKCYGWVLMPNHFHLLIITSQRPLSDLMRKVLTGYALYFNRKYKRSGYLYQNRYKSILCQEESYLLELVRYIHLNPLRGRLVRDLEELEKYKWSGHSVLCGKTEANWQSADEILERFAILKGEAVKRYLEFIKDGASMGRRDDLTGGGLRRSAGGWEGVRTLKRNKEYWRSDERILGDGDFVGSVLKISEEEMERKNKLLQAGWNIERIVKRASEIMGINEKDIKKRGRGNNLSKARTLVTYWSHKELGIKGTELANYFGISKQSILESVAKGEKLVKENNYNLST